MSKLILSIALTIVFLVSIIIGISFFHIMSSILNNTLLVTGIGVLLLFIITYIALNEAEINE